MPESPSLRKRSLVTGGAGFIGSHLCDALIARGHDVICLDNLFTGAKANIDHLLANPQFEFLNHDVIEPIHLDVDEIYNLACPASPIHYQREPVETIRTCVQGAINLLDLAKRLDCKILQASTSEVYGDPLQHPQKENYWGNVNPVGIRSCFDEGKRCAETLFFDYHREYGVAIKVARIFNTYGPRMQKHDGRVVSNFIVQSLCGQSVTVHGDGSQSRTFCYVDDIVRGLIDLMNTPENVTGPVNLGSDRETTIKDLALVIADVTEKPLGIEYSDKLSDDPCQRQPDLALAEQLLYWRTRTDLRQRLAATVNFFQQVLCRADCQD